MKKERGEKVEEYRGATLMPTLYKVYTIILAERLKRELKEKRVVPDNQTGFRRRMGNICVLNYLINRQLRRKGGI